jgi:hypothetical protein
MTETEKKDAIAQRYYKILAEWKEFAREALKAEKRRTVFVDYPLKPKQR